MNNHGPTLLADSHVHFHACFTWRLFLDAAAANFDRARRRLGLTNESPGCLMFTESAGVNYCRELMNEPSHWRSLGWHVDKGDDQCSFMLSRAGQGSIVIVAGRQIVTAERLEVLALGCVHEFPDGRPVRDVVRAVSDYGSPAVIPWGFGKWWGRRGRLLRRLIESAEDAPFYLGDNGCRPRLVQRPQTLGLAESRGTLVLGGSDPLSIPSHVTRAGSYGFVLDDWIATSDPASAIKARIQALAQSPRPFGELSSLPSVIRSQIGIRWRRHAIGASRRTPAVA